MAEQEKSGVGKKAEVEFEFGGIIPPIGEPPGEVLGDE